MRKETLEKFAEMNRHSDALSTKISGTKSFVHSILNDHGSSPDKVKRSKDIVKQIGAQLDNMQDLYGELLTLIEQE